MLIPISPASINIVWGFPLAYLIGVHSLYLKCVVLLVPEVMQEEGREFFSSELHMYIMILCKVLSLYDTMTAIIHPDTFGFSCNATYMYIHFVYT